MSEQVLISLITSVFSFLGLIVAGVMTYFMAKLKQQQDLAATKVSRVAHDLEVKDILTNDKLDNLTQVAHDTHVLVNNNMAIQLRANASNARFRADSTKLPEDVVAANMADNLLSDHISKQAAVNRSNKEKP